MAEGSFSRHHNGPAPYWSRVLDVVDRLRPGLRKMGRGKKWERRAEHLDLTEIAQWIVITELGDQPRRETPEAKALRDPQTETAEQRAVRLSARQFERSLLSLRGAVMRARDWRGDPNQYALLDDLNADIATAHRYAWPPKTPTAVKIAAAVVRCLTRANHLARLYRPDSPLLPTGLGSTGLVIGLTCEAMELLDPGAKAPDAVAVRKLLTEHRSVLGV